MYQKLLPTKEFTSEKFVRMARKQLLHRPELYFVTRVVSATQDLGSKLRGTVRRKFRKSLLKNNAHHSLHHPQLTNAELVAAARRLTIAQQTH